MGFVRHIESYVHQSRIGVLVELVAQTDFATRTDVFRKLASDLAMHVAALAPADTEALMLQRFVRNEAQTVAQRIEEAQAELYENIGIVRFVRWEIA